MVKRVDGWQDSRGKIWPTEEAAQKSQTSIDRMEGLFRWLRSKGLAERSQISVDSMIYIINDDWDNFLRLAITNAA